MADIDDIPISDDDDSELDADSMSNREFDEIAFDVDNPLMSDYEFLGEETREIDGEEVLLIVPDAIANEDIFVAESDNLDVEEIEEIDNDSTAVAETIEDYDNTAVIPTIGAVTAGERVMVVLKNGIPTAMGSTGFGDDINLRVHEIEADYIKTEVIEAERARVNNLLANKADVSSLTAEQVRVDNLLAGKASVDDLNAATGRIDDLEADHVSTDDLEAVNGKITNLETNALTANSAVIRDIQAETAKVENLTAESLSAATGYIAALKSASIEASDISADHATIATINSDYIKTSDLEAERADIDDLLADKADISDLTAATGRIGALEADHVSTDDLEAEQVRVNNLLAGKASVSDLTAEQARVNNLLADKADISTLEAEYAHVTNGTIDNAKINHAYVTGLNAEVASIADARIGQATIRQAQVENLSADYAKITNGKISSALIDVAAIVDEQVFTVTGNKATIEEINADTITVRNLHTANLVVDSAEGYVTIGNKKTPTKEALDALVGTLQNEIDGAVETFTSSAVPLLTNYPASDWQVSGATAEEQRKAYAKHVGDICYVQNSASAQNGYAYRFAYDSTEQTFKWVLIKDSDVTKALGDISDLQTFESETNTWIEEIDEGLRTIRENHTSLSGIVDKTLVSSTQLWFSKANTTAPSKPTAEVTSTSTAGNAWRTVVPAYNAGYPNYFYCYQWKYADDTFGWSAVTRDIAMGESQAQARKGVSDAAAAQNTANANIKSSVQLWFTKANNSAPAKPTSVISTNNAATGNAWNLAVPTYNASYPHYFYCYQQQKGDGTYQWTDVVYDRATTENQAVARAALPSSTFETFKTTTFKEVVDTVGEQSTAITTLGEKTSTLANPNLTPWFSAQTSVYWNTLLDANDDYATGHKHSESAEGLKDITYLNDGWMHAILDSRASAGNENKSCYINTWVNRNQLDKITPGGTYTWLIEVRNLNISKSTLRVRPSIGNDTLDIFSAVPVNTTDSGCEFSEDGVKWIQVTAKSDLSNVTHGTCGYIYVITDVYVEADVRVSLYEGEYSGPYKPYVERLESITEISNTVNTVKQTADTNLASITNLTKTVSDNKTDIEQRASIIEQNLSGIETRVSNTESELETVSSPNLSPFFSQPFDDIYDATNNPNGYWKRITINPGFTTFLTEQEHNGSGGWAHFVGNVESGGPLCRFEPMPIDTLKSSTKYTFVVEIDGTMSNSGNCVFQLTGAASNSDTVDQFASRVGVETKESGIYYRTVNTAANFTNSTGLARAYFQVYGNGTFDVYLRISIYEGEYSGSYKPYVDQTLISRVSTAETKIEQNSEAITLRATKTEAQRMAHPNLSPWFSLQPIENDAEHWRIVSGDATFTPLEDGWVHLHNDNSSGTNDKRTDYQVMGSPSITPGADYTWLFEYRNNNSTGNNRAYIVQSSERVQFWGNDVVKVLEGKGSGGSTDLGPNQDFPPGTDGVYVKRVLKKAEEATSSHLDKTGILYLGCLACYAYAGSIADYDLRVSIYEGEYTGPYKPYSGTQLYASQAQLKVANDEIALRVEKSGVISSINQSAEAIKIKADKVQIDGTAVFSAIKDQADASYDAKGAASAVQTNLDNLAIGGRNYILNSASISASGIGSASGSGKEYLPVNVGQSYMDIAAGTEVVISFDLYMTVNRANPVLQVYNTDNKGPKAFSSVETGAGSSPGVLLRFTAEVGDVIDERISVVGYINDRNSPTLTYNFLEFYSDYGSSNWFSVSNLKMEIGNRPTDWSPAPEDIEASAINRSQRIYYRATSASEKPAANTTWLAASGTGYKNWSLSIPPLKSGDTKYPFLYTAVQTQTVAQQVAGTKCSCTPVLIDETTTVIDGATIITGSIHSNSLDANSVKADIVQTTNLNASKITSGNIATARMSANIVKAVQAKVSDLYALVAKIGGFVINATSIFSGTGVTSNADNSIALSTEDFTRTINSTSRAGLRFAIGDKFGVTGDGTLYAHGANIVGINADNINSGSIGADRIKANVISAVNNGTGTINADKINVSAIKIGDLFDGDSVDAASKTAISYLTDITGGGVKVHSSTSDTTGVWITDDVDIMRNGTSVAMFGTDQNSQAISRIGYEDSGHTEQTSDTFTIYADHPTEGLSVAAEISTGSEEVDGATFRTNKLNFSTPNGPAYLETIERGSLGSQLKLWIDDTINTWPSLLLGLSTVISNQTRTARIEFVVEDEGPTELNLYADSVNLPANSIRSIAIKSLAASKITGTLATAQIPNLNASKITDGTLNTARLPTVPIDKGGTGDTGVEKVTAQATIFSSVASGMTISNLTCATWGKMCMLSFTVHPSSAQTSAFTIGTLATAYRPVAVCTANPYHSSVATARILTNGVIQMTAAPSNDIPVSFTYLLMNDTIM